MLRPAHLLAAVTLSFASCALGCEGRPRYAPPAPSAPRAERAEPHLGELDLRLGAPEEGVSGLLGANPEKGFAALVLQLRQLRNNEQLRGLLVRLGTATVTLAQAEELGRTIGALRAPGRPVVCHADQYDNATMLLAARGCDEIWLSPSGTVETVGIAGQLVFGRELLEKLSIDADFLQVGKYKGASEPFTRDSASPESLESLRGTLAELRAAWADGITAGRGADAESLGIEAGPFAAAEALARGLVDREGYSQQALDAALGRVGVDNRVVYFGEQTADPPGIGEIIRLLSGTRAHAEPYVAVVPATGAIAMAGGSPLDGAGISSRALSRQLRRLAEDEMAVAVVLRIDSPGGSALGSDLLWKELMDLRALKPVVASVGSMAASGGCYLSAAATKTVAERTSIVGSIGVVAGKFSFGRSLEEIGIHVETVEASEGTGARAVYGSALTPWDPATRERVEAAVQATYDLFVRRVAEGRGEPVEVVESAAEGRIFGGLGGKERALVDELGGLDEAIELALSLGGLPADTAVEIVAEPSGLGELLGGGEESSRAPGALERRAAVVAWRTALAGLGSYRSEIGTFVGMMSPLLHGERLLAAPPFMLVVR